MDSKKTSNQSEVNNQAPIDQPAPSQSTVQPAGSIARHRMRNLALAAALIVIAGAATFIYLHFYHHSAKPAAVKHDVPLIRFGTLNGPVNVFYPSADTANVSGEQLVNTQMFEGLVAWQNGNKLVPSLATSWTNPDDSTWIFTIRQGVKFHTGNTLSASDVKYSLDNFKDKTYSGDYGQTIKSTSVVSPTQVKVTTDGPDPLLLNRLSNLYIVDSKVKPDDVRNGTGPYVLKPGTDPAKDDTTDLIAFDQYWGGHVFTRELQFSQIVNQPEQVAALKNHKIDVFDNFIDTASVQELKAAGIKVSPQASNTVGQIIFNTLKPGSPLGNLKFRQALNVGIDRTAMIKAAGINGTEAGQFMVAAIPGYVPKIKPPVRDVAKAKALIAESQLKNPTLTLTYGTDSGIQRLLTEFQKESADLGIVVKLDPIDDIDTAYTKYTDGKTDMFFAGVNSTINDGSDILSTYQTPGVYDNATADKALEQANQTIDGAQHLGYLQQATEALNQDVAGLPIYSRLQYYAQTSSAYRLNPELPSVDAGVYFWKVYQN